ncbi:MAG TPA: AMP-binding protein, partial [Solirubrobacteraceae bacterium]
MSNTFHDLIGLNSRLEASLAARGFGAGDVLAVRLPNGREWIDAALGAMRLGGAVTGVSVVATDDEVRRQLVSSGAALLLTPDGLVAGPAPRPAPGVTLLPYSSGTGGLPKPVMLTHANLVSAIGQVLHGIRLTADDVVLALAPFSHVMGFVITLGSALAAGARLVPVPRFDPATFLELLERERVTVVIVPPPVMPLLARSPRDLPAVELIVCGGAPLGAGLQQAVAARFPRAAVGQLADGRVVLVAVDGDQPGYSVGMSNYELALAMQRLGAQTAMALAPARAAALAFDGTLLSKPSGPEQPVAEALSVLYYGVYALPLAAPVEQLA